MIRRSFLGALAGIPFFGFLKHKKEDRNFYKLEYVPKLGHKEYVPRKITELEIGDRILIKDEKITGPYFVDSKPYKNNQGTWTVEVIKKILISKDSVK